VKKELDSMRISTFVISEFVRDLIRKKVIDDKIDVESNEYNQIVITSQLMNLFWKGINSESCVVLSERTPICTTAYTLSIKSSSFLKSLNIEFIKNLFNTPGIKILLFYFPPIIPYVQDDIRKEKGRLLVDKKIRKILKDFNIPFIEVKTTDIKERVNLIISHIKENQVQ